MFALFFLYVYLSLINCYLKTVVYQKKWKKKCPIISWCDMVIAHHLHIISWIAIMFIPSSVHFCKHLIMYATSCLFSNIVVYFSIQPKCNIEESYRQIMSTGWVYSHLTQSCMCTHTSVQKLLNSGSWLVMHVVVMGLLMY